MSGASPDPDGTLAVLACVETLFRTSDWLTPDPGPSSNHRMWLAVFLVVTSLAGGVGLFILLVAGFVELVKWSATIGRRPVAAPPG